MRRIRFRGDGSIRVRFRGGMLDGQEYERPRDRFRWREDGTWEVAFLVTQVRVAPGEDPSVQEELRMVYADTGEDDEDGAAVFAFDEFQPLPAGGRSLRA